MIDDQTIGHSSAVGDRLPIRLCDRLAEGLRTGILYKVHAYTYAYTHGTEIFSGKGASRNQPGEKNGNRRSCGDGGIVGLFCTLVKVPKNMVILTNKKYFCKI